MEYRPKTSAYFNLVLNLLQGMLEPALINPDEKFKEAMMNTIFGHEGPRSTDHTNSPYELFIASKLFKPMSEILNTIEAIENIAVYARSFPYKRQGVSRVAYLKYHVENYLHELYLLKNRLISYLKLVERAYKKSEISEHVHNSILPLYKIINNALKGYIDVRGTHVHQNRYTDNDFDRLSSLELLSRGQDQFGVVMNNLLDSAYTETRKKWNKTIKTDISALVSLLEHYFETLLRAITINGELIFPNGLKRGITTA